MKGSFVQRKSEYVLPEFLEFKKGFFFRRHSNFGTKSQVQKSGDYAKL